MRKQKFIYILSVIVLINMAVQSITAQNPVNVKKTIEELSAVKYCGRSLINEGDKKAAEWIASMYSAAKLKKWNNDYFQKFTVSGNTFPGKVEVSLEGKKLIPADDYYLRLSCPDTVASFETLNFYDKDMNPAHAASLLETDMKNKALVVDLDFLMDLHEPDSIMDKVFKKDIGAYIFLSGKTIRWYNIYGNRIIHKPMIDMKKSSYNPDAKKLTVSAEAKFIKDYPTQNVIGYIDGKTKKDEYVVICGHYDHLGMMGDKVYFPGADDNASAIGVMLELANYYSIPENTPDKTIVFAAFGSEETGLQGSEWFVNNCPVDTSKIKMVINLDMVAFGKDSFIVYNGVENPEIMKTVNGICKKQKFPFVYMPRENIPHSDHFSFTDKGIPAIFITSGADRSPYYHTNKDDYKSAPYDNIKELMQSIIEFVKLI